MSGAVVKLPAAGTCWNCGHVVEAHGNTGCHICWKEQLEQHRFFGGCTQTLGREDPIFAALDRIGFVLGRIFVALVFAVGVTTVVVELVRVAR